MSSKAKSAPSTNAPKKSKGVNGAAVTVASSDVSKLAAAPASGSGKPEKGAYDAEQERIKTEIDALQVKLAAVKEKISLISKSEPGNDRRNMLRTELDSLRGQQSNSKASRGKVLDQLKALQDGIQKKVKDLQAAKGKTQFKTVAEVEAHIKNLEKQVDSGNLKLAEEKRALQEISQVKRARKNVESFQADADAIEADRARADELRQQLDDPESKTVSERYDTIKAELDELKKESDQVYASRNKLFDERTALQTELDTLYNQKRDSAQRFREANDRYWAKVNEDRARRAERARAQRAAEEEQKKKELAERLRDEASQPAFQLQIEDCQTLIDYFSGKSTTAPITSISRATPVDEPKLDIRKVETGPEDGLLVRKKKGDEDDAYFVGGKGKRGKKNGAKVSGSTTPSEAAPNGSSTSLNIPLPTLSALLTLSIPPPASSADLPRVVEDLKTKKAWFKANQARVTAEAIAKAEADIRRLTGANGKVESKSVPESPAEVSPPNGAGEAPSEPTFTPKAQDLPEAAVTSEDVVEKLEEVQEQVGVEA